jgi:hypothetical protein
MGISNAPMAICIWNHGVNGNINLEAAGNVSNEHPVLSVNLLNISRNTVVQNTPSQRDSRS